MIDLSGWTEDALRHELRYQPAEGIHTIGRGGCGPRARGARVCASCLQTAFRSLKPCTCPSGEGSLRWPCPQHARLTRRGNVRHSARV